MIARGILAALVAGTALLVPQPNQTDSDAALPLMAKVAAQAPDTPTASKRERKGFLSPNIDSPHPFKPVMGSHPERICDRLDEAGFANLDWRGSEVAGVWECMARVDEEGEAGSVDRNSLFYLLRGEASRRITYARLKINVPDVETSAETLGRAQEFMRVFAGAANFALPPDLLDAIAAREPTNIVLEGITFRLKPEFEDPDRLNLSIEFGPALYAFHRLPKASGLPPLVANPPANSTLTDGKGARLRKAE
jgi:hypothetical protein